MPAIHEELTRKKLTNNIIGQISYSKNAIQISLCNTSHQSLSFSFLFRKSTEKLRLLNQVLQGWLTRFGLKMGQIGPKWDKSGTFSDQIPVHFGSSSQSVLKSDLKKSWICPIWGQSDTF